MTSFSQSDTTTSGTRIRLEPRCKRLPIRANPSVRSPPAHAQSCESRTELKVFAPGARSMQCSWSRSTLDVTARGLSPAREGVCPHRSMTVEAATVVPRSKVQRGAKWHDASRVDSRHAHVVVTLDVVHVDGLGDAGKLQE